MQRKISQYLFHGTLMQEYQMKASLDSGQLLNDDTLKGNLKAIKFPSIFVYREIKGICKWVSK